MIGRTFWNFLYDLFILHRILNIVRRFIQYRFEKYCMHTFVSVFTRRSAIFLSLWMDYKKDRPCAHNVLGIICFGHQIDAIFCDIKPLVVPTNRAFQWFDFWSVFCLYGLLCQYYSSSRNRSHYAGNMNNKKNIKTLHIFINYTG